MLVSVYLSISVSVNVSVNVNVNVNVILILCSYCYNSMTKMMYDNGKMQSSGCPDIAPNRL